MLLLAIIVLLFLCLVHRNVFVVLRTLRIWNGAAFRIEGLDGWELQKRKVVLDQATEDIQATVKSHNLHFDHEALHKIRAPTRRRQYCVFLKLACGKRLQCLSCAGKERQKDGRKWQSPCSRQTITQTRSGFVAPPWFCARQQKAMFHCIAQCNGH